MQDRDCKTFLLRDKGKVFFLCAKTPDNKFVLGFYKKLIVLRNSSSFSVDERYNNSVSESDRHVLRLALRSIFHSHSERNFQTRILCEFI